MVLALLATMQHCRRNGTRHPLPLMRRKMHLFDADLPSTSRREILMHSIRQLVCSPIDTSSSSVIRSKKHPAHTTKPPDS